jgi:hypothetical protein
MNSLTSAADLLRGLPRGVRKAIYTVLALLGAALAVCVGIGVEDIGPVTVERLLQVYAYLSPVMGAVAVANVAPGATDSDPAGFTTFDEDADLSSFEPVGDESDVFAEAID